MASIDITTQSGAVGNGDLQLQNGAPMDTTLRFVTDAVNTASPLKLSTSLVQTTSTLKITTNDNPYIDAEDGAGNNRFTIGRDSSSQQVNLDFASNPAGSTTTVGAIRTYVDGVNLSEVMTFREDGATGIVSQLYLGNTNSLLSNNRFQILNSANTAIMVNVDNNGSISTNGRFQIYNSARTAIAQAMYYDGATMVFRPMNDGVESTRFSNNAQDKTMLRFDGVTGNVDVGTGTTLGASLGIKGSGSTSATTSLLVQNSAGTQLLKVADDGQLNLRNTIVFDLNTAIFDGGAWYQTVNNSSCTIYGDGGASSGLRVTGSTYGSGASQVQIKGSTSISSGFNQPDASAQLDLQSTTKGFLPPRMTDAQIRAIATPAEGLIAYNTDISHLCCYQAGAWVKFSHTPM